MTFNMPYSVYQKLNSFLPANLHLRLNSHEAACQNQTEIFELLKKKQLQRLSLYFSGSNVSLIKKITQIHPLQLIIDQKNTTDFINFHYALSNRNQNIKIMITGAWNAQTVKIIKKIVMIGYSVTVLFDTIKTINQSAYMDLLNFIFFNNHIKVNVEPFQSLFQSFLENRSHCDLYQIYGEQPGHYFYVDEQQNIAINYINAKNQKFIGQLGEDSSQWFKSGLYQSYLWPQQITSEQNCYDCPFLNICQGYIKNNYHTCLDWIEIFASLKDLAWLLKIRANQKPL